MIGQRDSSQCADASLGRLHRSDPGQDGLLIRSFPESGCNPREGHVLVSANDGMMKL